MDTELEKLLQSDGRIWRGKKTDADLPFVASGFPELDRVLPGGGWPVGALIEIRASTWGIGELRLLLPVMRLLNKAGRWVVWIRPPFEPYAPALCRCGLDVRRMLVVERGIAESDGWWAMEKFLRHPGAGLVMVWPKHLEMTTLRRLQLAAAEGGTMGVLFHSQEITGTPAALRIALQPIEESLEVRIQKARGGSGRSVVRVMPG